MADTVFILGAGASFEAGAPLMNNFLDVARDVYFENPNHHCKTDFEKVFAMLKNLQILNSKTKLDLYNVESVFNILEMAKILGVFPGLSVQHETEIESDLNELSTSLKRIIVSTIESTMVFKSKPVEDYRLITPSYPIELFARMIKKALEKVEKDISILTFNYDVGIDLGLESVRIYCDYGYDYKTHHRRDQSVKLLKLHGSLNWAEDLTSNEIYPVSVRSFLIKELFFQLTPSPIAIEKIQLSKDYKSRIEKYFRNNSIQDRQIKNAPFLVPPSWNKTDQYKSISKVWKMAAQELSDCRTLVIIGYSLPETDAFFNQLFALGTFDSDQFKDIFIVDPDPSNATLNRFKRLFGHALEPRVKHIKKNFSDGLEDLCKNFKINYNDIKDSSSRSWDYLPDHF